MIGKRLIAVTLLVTGMLGLFGCRSRLKGGSDTTDASTARQSKSPFLLDGDGMVYVDEDYRTEYANALPYDEYHSESKDSYFSAVYLGKGEDGRQNASAWINRLFAGKLTEEKLNAIAHYDFGGEDWFLVVPRYPIEVTITPDNDSTKAQTTPDATPFTVSCNEAKLYISSYGGRECILKADSNGKISDGNAWDISNLRK